MSAGAAATGAAVGSLAGPGGAAIGAAGGVVAVELLEEEAPTEIVGDSPASTIHETASLIETVGLWYLLIFVLLPFLTKRGRGWLKNLTQLHDNVSKKEVESLMEELKKQVDSFKWVLNKLGEQETLPKTMKYIENNDELGIMPADSAVANMIMENLGYDTQPAEAPNIIAVDDSLFALSPEICEIEETLCIRLEELDDRIFESVKENPELTESVDFDDESFSFDDVVEYDGGIYVTLVSENIEYDEESDDYVMEVNGVEFDVTDDEDDADSYAFISENEDGDYFVVDTEEEADYVVYLNEK